MARMADMVCETQTMADLSGIMRETRTMAAGQAADPFETVPFALLFSVRAVSFLQYLYHIAQCKPFCL